MLHAGAYLARMGGSGTSILILNTNIIYRQRRLAGYTDLTLDGLSHVASLTLGLPLSLTQAACFGLHPCPVVF